MYVQEIRLIALALILIEDHRRIPISFGRILTPHDVVCGDDVNPSCVLTHYNTKAVFCRAALEMRGYPNDIRQQDRRCGVSAGRLCGYGAGGKHRQRRKRNG